MQISQLNKKNFLRVLPNFFVVIWLFFLAITIWQHAANSVQPPLYDPLSYVQKAMNFWRAVSEGKLFSPLNIVPTVRPPGTILMSYPFGFTPEFNGFYFRSAFLPILCIVAAVYIIAGVVKSSSAWATLSIAILCSSLPMFFYFDWGQGVGGWGLVDCFHAGVAAMALAVMVRSLATRSLRTLFLGTLLASFTLLIKPSGMMIMLQIALLWIMVIACEWRYYSKHNMSRTELRRYLLKGGVILLVVYASIIIACIFSEYLSRGNLLFAKQVLIIARDVLKFNFKQTLTLLHNSIGVTLLLWLFCVSLSLLWLKSALKKVPDILRVLVFAVLAGSLPIWSSGAWYWLSVQAGGNGEIRYFYPFMLMGIVCFVPAALIVWAHSRPLAKAFLFIICLLPALNVGALLVHGDDPPKAWQTAVGVGITVGNDREVVSQAYAFLDLLKEDRRSANIYSFSSALPYYIFENVGKYEEMVHQEQPGFKSVIPIDWLRGFAIRVDELLGCDYVIVYKREVKNAYRLLSQEHYDSFQLENRAFELWMLTLKEQAGIEIVDDGQLLRLLRIVDKVKLSKAIEEFVAAHTWRLDFQKANQQVWWKAEEVKARAKTPAAAEISFEGVYRLHAIEINRIDTGLKVEAWWDELKHEEMNSQRFLFLHLIDSSGNILHNQQIALHPYTPPLKDRRWRRHEVIFPLQFPDKSVAKLAFGIYHANGSFLLPDKGTTDWEGKRVLLPVTMLTGAKAPPESSKLSK